MEALVIPIRLDATRAAASLRTLGQAGRTAGDEIAAGLDKAGKGAKGAGDEMANFLKGGMALGAVKNLATGFAAEMDAIAERSKAAAREFASLQKSMQGLSAMMGRANTTAFTEEQIKAGEMAGMTPQAWAKFADTVQSKASSYLTGPLAKMTPEDSLKAQQKIAAGGALIGLAPEDSAAIFSDIVIQSKGKLTARDAVGAAARAMKKAQESGAKPGEILRQAPRLTAAGFSTDEALNLMGPSPEWAPGEESTSILGISEGLRDALAKNRGIEGLGITDEQTPYQRIKAAVTVLKERQARGENVEKQIARIAPERIGARGLMGLVNRMDFKKWEGFGADESMETMNRRIAEGRKTEGGARLVEEAGLAAEEARLGARIDPAARMLMRAEERLMADPSKPLEKPGMGEFAAQKLFTFGGLAGQGLREQQIAREAIRAGREQLGEGMGAADVANTYYQNSSLQTLNEIAAELKKQNAMAEKAAVPPPAPPLIMAPPGAGVQGRQ